MTTRRTIDKTPPIEIARMRMDQARDRWQRIAGQSNTVQPTTITRKRAKDFTQEPFLRRILSPCATQWRMPDWHGKRRYFQRAVYA
jgi:hypothetical protein